MAQEVKSVKGSKVVGWMFVAIGLAFATSLVVAYLIYGIVKSVPGPFPSPDGTMMASVSVTDSRGEEKTHMRILVEIRDERGTVLLSRQTRASALREYHVEWEGNSKLKLASTEVGDLFWTRDAQGQWADDPGNGSNVVPAVGEAAEAGKTPKP